MAKSIPPEGSSQPATQTARVAVELLEQARIICAHTKDASGKQLKLTDYIDSILRPAVTRDHENLMERLTQAQTKKPKK